MRIVDINVDVGYPKQIYLRKGDCYDDSLPQWTLVLSTVPTYLTFISISISISF